jgi:hypothetical protein
MVSAKAGRKRDINAKRRQSGHARATAVDLGTPEAQAHRLRLVGNADPALSESALGILYARGFLIDPNDPPGDEGFELARIRRDAGWQFETYRAGLFGPIHPAGAQLADLVGGGGAQSGNPFDPIVAEADTKRRERYEAADAGLKSAGQAVARDTKLVCHQGEVMVRYVGRGTAARIEYDPATLDRIRTGLSAIAMALGREKRNRNKKDP